MVLSTTDTDAAFLDRIANATGAEAEAARLIYADWLEEQGDSRCELVRRYVADRKAGVVLSSEDADGIRGQCKAWWLYVVCPAWFVTVATKGINPRFIPVVLAGNLRDIWFDEDVRQMGGVHAIIRAAEAAERERAS